MADEHPEGTPDGDEQFGDVEPRSPEPGLDLVAVRVGPDGYLYAPIPPGVGLDPVEAVESFLEAVSVDELERLVLNDFQEHPTAVGFVEALKFLARQARR